MVEWQCAVYCVHSAVVALLKAIKKTKEAIEVSGAKELSIQEANRLPADSEELICIRGEVTTPKISTRLRNLMHGQTPGEESDSGTDASIGLLEKSLNSYDQEDNTKRIGVYRQRTDKFMYQEYQSPLRRIASRNILSCFPVPTFYIWPVHPNTMIRFTEYRESWCRLEKLLRTTHESVPFGVRDGTGYLGVSRDEGLAKVLGKQESRASGLGVLERVAKQHHAMPWAIDDWLREAFNGSDEGRCRPLEIVHEERMLMVGGLVTVVGKRGQAVAQKAGVSGLVGGLMGGLLGKEAEEGRSSQQSSWTPDGEASTSASSHTLSTASLTSHKWTWMAPAGEGGAGADVTCWGATGPGMSGDGKNAGIGSGGPGALLGGLQHGVKRLLDRGRVLGPRPVGELCVQHVTRLTKKQLVRSLACGAAANFGWAIVLSGISAVILRRQVARLAYIIRWGQPPHDAVQPLDDDLDSEVSEPLDDDQNLDGDWDATVQDRIADIGQVDTGSSSRMRRVSSSGSIGSRRTCVVCLSRHRRMVFIPCGHKACCATCAHQVAHARNRNDRRCPVCRQEIRREVIRVYDP